MLNAKTNKLKKIIKKKKYPRIVNILKEFIKAINITKRILNQKINLIISKLLVSALVIEKQLIKAITKDKIV